MFFEQSHKITPGERLQHLDEIVELSEQLKKDTVVQQVEQRFRELELIMVKENIAHIRHAAHDIGKQLVDDPRLPLGKNPEDLAWQRYIIVPLLSKLGFAEQAAKLKQQTFELLFPALHRCIQKKLDELYGEDRLEKAKEILNLFNSKHPNVIHSYARTMKSTDAIWKKLPSIQVFQTMTTTDVANIVDDLVALRWNMRINEGENRYDALINGLRLLPTEHIVRFRNQQVQQSSGFSCEPVMKFYYVINEIPIECQLLAGCIEWYMNAKGYTDYKVNYSFPPLKTLLTEEQYNARLGLCLYYQQTGRETDYHQLMLQELMAEQPLCYDTRHTLLLDEQPLNQNNSSLTFADNESQAIYELPNHNFPSRSMGFSRTHTFKP